MSNSKLRELGLMALVVALAVGWGIDHARLTRTGDADDDVELEVLKARARVIPQRDELPYPESDLLFKSSELSPEELSHLQHQIEQPSQLKLSPDQR